MVDPSVLFLSPSFLSYRLHKQVRGVQLFEFQFIRELVAHGVDVTIPAERTWKPGFAEHLRGVQPTVVWTPTLRRPTWNALAAALLLPKRRYGVAYLGNVARGMLPGVELMRQRGLWSRMVVQANRAPRPAFIRAQRRWRARVVAVSADIARYFPPETSPPVEVFYGVLEADQFYPRAEPRADGLVRFGMLGKLDTALKNVPMVLEAFRALPHAVRARAELHLIAYPSPPGDLGPGVVAYPWQAPAAVPALLRDLDALIIASDSETFAQGAVQAMLCGVPVISRDLPALREKLHSGAGVLFQTGAELVSAMTLVAQDANFRARAGAIGRALALERYVWDTPAFVRRYLFPDGAPADA